MKRKLEVMHDYGSFSLYEHHGDFAPVEVVKVPDDIDGHIEERDWFFRWCEENNIEPEFA